MAENRSALEHEPAKNHLGASTKIIVNHDRSALEADVATNLTLKIKEAISNILHGALPINEECVEVVDVEAPPSEGIENPAESTNGVEETDLESRDLDVEDFLEAVLSKVFEEVEAKTPPEEAPESPQSISEATVVEVCDLTSLTDGCLLEAPLNGEAISLLVETDEVREETYGGGGVFVKDILQQVRELSTSEHLFFYSKLPPKHQLRHLQGKFSTVEKMVGKSMSENTKEAIEDLVDRIKQLPKDDYMTLRKEMPVNGNNIFYGRTYTYTQTLTLQWIKTHVVASPNHLLHNQILYQAYSEFCQRVFEQPFNMPTFGKYVKQLFPDLAQKRIRTPNGARSHYVGLKLTSHLATPSLPKLSDNSQSPHKPAKRMEIATTTAWTKPIDPPPADTITTSTAKKKHKKKFRPYRHPTVRRLMRKNRRIKIPESVFRFNVSPRVQLDTNEASAWYVRKFRDLKTRVSHLAVAKAESGERFKVTCSCCRGDYEVSSWHASRLTCLKNNLAKLTVNARTGEVTNGAPARVVKQLFPDAPSPSRPTQALDPVVVLDSGEVFEWYRHQLTRLRERLVLNELCNEVVVGEREAPPESPALETPSETNDGVVLSEVTGMLEGAPPGKKRAREGEVDPGAPKKAKMGSILGRILGGKYACFFCDKEFEHRTSLLRHEKTHLFCKTCWKSLDTPRQMRSHLIDHCVGNFAKNVPLVRAVRVDQVIPLLRKYPNVFKDFNAPPPLKLAVNAATSQGAITNILQLKNTMTSNLSKILLLPTTSSNGTSSSSVVLRTLFLNKGAADGSQTYLRIVDAGSLNGGVVAHHDHSYHLQQSQMQSQPPQLVQFASGGAGGGGSRNFLFVTKDGGGAESSAGTSGAALFQDSVAVNSAEGALPPAGDASARNGPFKIRVRSLQELR